MGTSRLDGVKAPQHRGTPRSHRMFHPSGPNFLLSKMFPWKKHKADNILLNASDFAQVSKSSGFTKF